MKFTQTILVAFVYACLEYSRVAADMNLVESPSESHSESCNSKTIQSHTSCMQEDASVLLKFFHPQKEKDKLLVIIGILQILVAFVIGQELRVITYD